MIDARPRASANRNAVRNAAITRHASDSTPRSGRPQERHPEHGPPWRTQRAMPRAPTLGTGARSSPAGSPAAAPSITAEHRLRRQAQIRGDLTRSQEPTAHDGGSPDGNAPQRLRSRRLRARSRARRRSAWQSGQRTDSRRTASNTTPQSAHDVENGPSRRSSLMFATYSGFAARHSRFRSTAHSLHQECSMVFIFRFRRNRAAGNNNRHRAHVLNCGTCLISAPSREGSFSQRGGDCWGEPRNPKTGLSCRHFGDVGWCRRRGRAGPRARRP